MATMMAVLLVPVAVTALIARAHMASRVAE
jgi:hypothetical protein